MRPEPREPDWVRHVLWWHVYPLGFVGAPIRDLADETLTHRLGRIEAWLDHLVGIGLNGLLLGPVFASESHGYDTIDYFTIDPRLGDEADLLHLIEAAHGRGIRVLLDGVFNHVGRSHPAFQRVEREGPQSTDAALFRIRSDGWHPGDPVSVDVFEGHGTLVGLDHTSPAVDDLVVAVMSYWLDRGIDGWRLDAAYAVPPAFWARVLPRVRRAHPDAWFSGEVIHGDQAAIVEESTMNSLTQYELWQGIWHGIADRNFFELAHAITRHVAMLDTFAPTTFVGNHDVTRLATAVSPRFLPHALAVLLTVGGVPCLYAGDEFGYTATKEERVGGDDAVRPEFPGTPPSPADLDPAAAAALDVTRALVAVRRQHPWLHEASTDVVMVANTTLVLRSATPTQAIVLALSLEDSPVALPTAGARRVIAGSGRLVGETVELDPGGWAVMALD